jgi:hypothetical protein
MSSRAFVAIAVRVAVVLLLGTLAACGGTNPSVVRPDDVAMECGVAADPGRTQFIIGYGSLMQDDSRKRTAPQAGPAHPVEVHGFRRAWIQHVQTGSFGITFLGLRPDEKANLNAVIYQVDQDELAATDKRESSYCRAGVPATAIQSLEVDFAPAADAQTWIYVSKTDGVALPDAKFPIVQSYVDIFVGGCLEQGQRFGLPDFARQCIATTDGWSQHWVNDRIYPRRPFIHQPKAGQIDKLLAGQLPAYFSHIRIEGGG